MRPGALRDFILTLYLKRQKKQCLKKHASRNILSFLKTFYLKSMIYENFSLELYFVAFHFGISKWYLVLVP